MLFYFYYYPPVVGGGGVWELGRRAGGVRVLWAWCGAPLGKSWYGRRLWEVGIIWQYGVSVVIYGR